MQRPISDFNRENQGSYTDRFHEYIDAELHPETAQHIGEIVNMGLRGEEFAMSVILQMQLDPIRKEIAVQAAQDAIAGPSFTV